MTAPAAAPQVESAVDRIARLRRELADAEIDQVGKELESVVNEFWNFVPDFWREMDEDAKSFKEIQALTGFCREAWAKFEAWREAARAATQETTERRPYLSLSQIAASSPVAFQKRPSGSGSTYRSGNGWKWRLQVAGNLKRGRTWPTREEAEAELALAVADPEFVPVRPDYKRLSPTSKHRCSRCGGEDHKANRCPVLAQVLREQSESAGGAGGAGAPTPPPSADLPPPLPIAAPVVMGNPAPTALAAPPAAAQSTTRAPKRGRVCSNCKQPGHNAATCTGQRQARGSIVHPPPVVELPPDLPEVEEGDEEGWSKADSDGRQTCVPCRGEGIDRRPGEGVGACCLNCDGEGYRWPDVTQEQAAPPLEHGAPRGQKGKR